MIAAARDAIPPHASSALAPDDEAPPSPPLPPPPLSSALLPSAALVVASASRALEAKNTACRDHTEIFAEMMPKMCPPGGHSPDIRRDIRRDGACLRTDSRASSTVPAGPSAPGGCAGEARAARSAGTADAAWVGEYWSGHISGASRPVHVLTHARTTKSMVHLTPRGSHLGCISANSRLHDREHGAVHLAPRGV